MWGCGKCWWEGGVGGSVVVRVGDGNEGWLCEDGDVRVVMGVVVEVWKVVWWRVGGWWWEWLGWC